MSDTALMNNTLSWEPHGAAAGGVGGLVPANMSGPALIAWIAGSAMLFLTAPGVTARQAR